MASSPLPRTAPTRPARRADPRSRVALLHVASSFRTAGVSGARLLAATDPRAWAGPLTRPLPRWLCHCVLILFLAGLALLSRLDLQMPTGGARQSAPAAPPTYQTLSMGPDFSTQGFLTKIPLPITLIPDRSQADWLTYSVKEYDTVYGVAESFGLSAASLYWSNPELQQNMNLLSIGQQLRIPPVDGIVHHVDGAETLEEVAATYEVSLEEIRQSPLNQEALALGGPLEPAQEIFVPGGYKEVPRPAPLIVRSTGPAAPSAVAPTNALAGSGRFGWPTDASRVTQWFWWGHQAVDIAGPVGTNIYAADSGWVETAGWSNVGYGYHVVINHNNGFRTLYAHLSQYWVTPGQNVVRGQPIGAIGITGRSTGPHLHFEIRYGGQLLDPFGFW